MVARSVETEVKFLVNDLAAIRKRLEVLGATITSARILETNLRFDTPDGSLRAGQRALRLRQDATTTLTYKGPGEFKEGIRSRTELELEVDGFESARRLLEALGYVVTFSYEKFRTTFSLVNAKVMLDELPFGEFVEIEGDADAIKDVAVKLGLRWDGAIEPSYLGLFERVKANLNLPFGDLSFENFRAHQIRPEDLGVEAADG